MGNRSSLYLETLGPDGEPTSVEFAEANNNFPVLWQLLLAGGGAAPAITTQRVFGDAGTDNLAADASQALARLLRLADFIARHPLRKRLPAIPLQFAALVTHLGACIAEAAVEGDVQLSASLDELAWLEGDGDNAAFIEDMRRQCAQRWDGVARCIDSEDFAGLLKALEIPRFDDWSDWAWGFGFSGLSHAYFHMREAPRMLRFEDFDESEEEGDARDWANCLGEGLWRFQADDGRWGVRREREDGTVDHVVLAPAWGELIGAHRPADADAAEDDTRTWFWAVRPDEALYGLLRIDAESASVLLPPELEEVGDFETGAHPGPVARVRRDGQEGWLRDDGQWLFAPQADTLYSFEHGFGLVRVGEALGFIDARGAWAVPPRFAEAESATAGGLAAARETADGLWGLVCLQGPQRGEWAAPPEWESLQWDDDLQGYLARRAKRVGLLGADGRPCILPEYVRLDAFDVAPGPLGQLVLARAPSGRVGLLDRQGVVRVPCDYSQIEAFDPVPDDGELLAAPSQVCVASREGKGRAAAMRRGVYDLSLRRETVPLAHSGLQLLRWHEAGQAQVAWLVAEPMPPELHETQGAQRMGVLRADGTVLHPPLYAWIAQALAVDEGWQSALVRSAIRAAWSRGEAVQAVPNEGDARIWLHADGRTQSHEEALRARAESGDRGAARVFAAALRDGDGMATDAVAARRWMAFAAGVPFTALDTAPSLGARLLAKVRGRHGAPVLQPAQAAPDGLPRAMYELALMLTDSEGGPQDDAAARAWLEHALAHGGADDADIQLQLGVMWATGAGGALDAARALGFYEQAAARGSAHALFNMGLIHEYGDAGPVDAARAMDCYRRADDAGHADAARHLGSLLRQQAETMEEAEAGSGHDGFAEAVYYLRKAADNEDCTMRPWACLALGTLVLYGQGTPNDWGEAAQCYRQGVALTGEDDAFNADARRQCIELLADVIYSDSNSPLRDAAEARAWRAQLG